MKNPLRTFRKSINRYKPEFSLRKELAKNKLITNENFKGTFAARIFYFFSIRVVTVEKISIDKRLIRSYGSFHLYQDLKDILINEETQT